MPPSTSRPVSWLPAGVRQTRMPHRRAARTRSPSARRPWSGWRDLVDDPVGCGGLDRQSSRAVGAVQFDHGRVLRLDGRGPGADRRRRRSGRGCGRRGPTTWSPASSSARLGRLSSSFHPADVVVGSVSVGWVSDGRLACRTAGCSAARRSRRGVGGRAVRSSGGSVSGGSVSGGVRCRAARCRAVRDVGRSSGVRVSSGSEDSGHAPSGAGMRSPSCPRWPAN